MAFQYEAAETASYQGVYMTVTNSMLNPNAPPIEFKEKRYRAELPRLVKKVLANDPAGALALIQYDRATSTPANDNDLLDTTVEDDYAWRESRDPDEPVVAAGVTMDTDSVDRTRPSEEEIIRAAPPGTPTTYERYDRRGKLVTDPGRKPKKSDTLRAICGDLVFDLTPGRKRPVGEGLLVEYGRTSKGRPRRPSYRMTGDKGAKTPKRTEAAVWDYLRRPPADIQSSGWRRLIEPRPPVGGGNHELPRSEREARFGPREGRDLLQRLGCDGEVEFVDAMLAARLGAVQLPAAIVAPVDAFGGVTQAHKADKTPQVPVPVRDPRGDLGERDKAVLEIALSGGTLEDIGVFLGAPASTAARHGKPALLAAVEEVKRVMGLAANDNAKISSAAA